MRDIIRTLYGSYAQTAGLLGLPNTTPSTHPFSTLNRAMTEPTIVDFLPANLNSGMYVQPTYDANVDSANIKLQYLVVGNGGIDYIQGPNPSAPPRVSLRPHQSTDTGLFHMVPIVVKPVSADLTTQQKAKYRLRRTMMITIDGVPTLHAAYFAKIIDLSTTELVAAKTVIAGNVVETQAFVPTINNLKPTPAAPSTVIANEASYTSVLASLALALDAQEVIWFQEACELLFGNVEYAIVSEVALCTGVDKAVTAIYNAAGDTTSATTAAEAVGVQVATFVASHHSTVFANNGIGIDLDVGATEPLFGTEE